MKYRILLSFAVALAPLASLQAQPNAAPQKLLHRGPGFVKAHPHKRLGVLDQQERAQLKAARQTLKGNPQLAAARQAVKAAPAGDTKQAARQELREVRRGLLLQADPSLGAVFAKIDAARAARKSRG